MDAEDKKNFLKYLLLLLFGGIVSMVGIGSIIPFIYLLIEPKKLSALPILNQFSYVQAVGIASLTLVLSFWLKNGTSFWVLKRQQVFLSTFAAKIRNKLFLAYINSPYHLHVRRNSSQLITNVNIEASQLSSQLSSIGNALNETLTSSFVLCLLLWVNVIFTTIVVGIILMTVKLFTSFTRGKAKFYGKMRATSGRELTKVISHGLGGIKETKIYQKESFFSKKAKSCAENFARSQVYATIFGQAARFIIETVGVTVLLGLIYAFILIGYSGQQVMLLISVFGATAVQFLPSMNRLTLALSQITYNSVSLDIIYNELKDYEPYLSNRNIVSPLPFYEEIRLENISYSYGKSLVLDNVNVTIPKGKKIALVGSTGAGKTTLVDIVLGILRPDKGKITCDKTVLNNENLSQWRSHFGYIPQMIYIYDCSIRENIAFGIERESIDDKEVWEALRQASLANFVREECQDGLDTIVGENGIRLSGGQRQRLGIARALYRNPDILVMDEATAALDNQTEREITKALENAEKNRTVITIAHRLSTIQNYDIIYMLEKGKVVASGNYWELQERSDGFKRMAEVV